MLVINQNGTQRDNAWYRNFPVKSKEEFGIVKMTVQELSDSQQASGLAGRVTVQTVGGLLFLAIWNSKAGDDTLYVTADNSQEMTDGRFFNSFIPSEEFRAFILQWAEANSSKSETSGSLPFDSTVATDDFEEEEQVI
jgi:hypothetical protein